MLISTRKSGREWCFKLDSASSCWFIFSADDGIAFVDQNTFPSLIETRKGLSPIDLAQESKVMAIYDLTFITEPYNGILDNNQLISNIADWLANLTEKETK